ncbi:tetratricopeptide repeat protein [Teladorsagia circumcincta]|uniref:RNA polymerase II-associated protein 3 n=1 Tax=Teladorsagia circumcincta TaxID=45464 RepID=A0A2G9UJE3_TELCI|nr:tetratricopeptide repeat protein [Teladorsagia circumcincta]
MDCNRALELDPKFAKALYRRACALEKMGLKSSAVEDLNRCLALAPNAAASALKEKLAGKRNADAIHVACVEKGDELRSDAEFVEIGIDVPQSSTEDIKKSEPPADDKNTIGSEIDEFQFRVPKTHREFLLDYRELQRFPPEKFVSYFLAIPTSVYSSLFGELLEADVIGRLLRGFASLLESNGVEAKEVSTCLLSLSDLPRFQLLSMFFGDDEKKDLVIICQFLPHSDSVAIRKRYGVEESSEE